MCWDGCFLRLCLFCFFALLVYLKRSDMARQTGILKFTGQLGGLSFYAHKHYGMLVRQSNPVSGERIRKDPAFARTRENGAEFGLASKAAKLLRHGLHGFLQDVGTELLDNRLMKHFLSVKNQDTASARGARNVASTLSQHPELLRGFELHARHTLHQLLGQSAAVDTAAGTVTLRHIVPGHLPSQATHIAVTAYRGQFDFEQFSPDGRDIRYSETVLLELRTQALADVVLTPDVPVLSAGSPSPHGTIELWGLKVVCMQEVNGILYPLQVGAAGILESLRMEVPVAPKSTAVVAREIPSGASHLLKAVVPERRQPAESSIA
jgi:hypothetical protein